MRGLRPGHRRPRITVSALLAYRYPVFSGCFRLLNCSLLVQLIAALECAGHTTIRDVRRGGRFAISELLNRIADETSWWKMAFSGIAAVRPTRGSGGKKFARVFQLTPHGDGK